MRKIFSWILSVLIEVERFTRIKVDKQLHFICSFIPAVVVGIFSPSLGAAFALGLGIGKEVGDAMSPHSKWSWGDIIADIVGILTGLLIVLW